MSIATRWEPVLTRLTQYRAVLLGQVADELFSTIPLLGVPMDAADPGAVHQGQMAETVARLHDALQTTRLHEQRLVDEVMWAARVLPHWGVSVAHVEQLIDCYLKVARGLGMARPSSWRGTNAPRWC